MTTYFDHPRSAFGGFSGGTEHIARSLHGGLDELAAYCMVQVGFVPTQSVCFVAMRPAPTGASELGPVARMDAGLLMKNDPFLVDGWMESLREQFASLGFSTIAMVLFGGTQQGDSFRREPTVGSTYGQIRASNETARVLGLLGAWDPDITAFLVVGSDGWGHYKCRYAGCCPPKGRPLEQLRSTQVMADAVLSGSVVAGSREELRVARCANPGCRAEVKRVMAWLERDAHVNQVTRGCDHWTYALRQMTAEDGAGDGVCSDGCVEGCVGGCSNGSGDAPCEATCEGACEATCEGACDPAQIGELAHAILNSRVRDAVVAYALSEGADVREGKTPLSGDGVLEFMDAQAADEALTAYDVPGARLEACATLLSQIAAHAPKGAQVQALAALGYVRWWQGRGAQAKVMVENALAIDARHTLANLVHTILYNWVPPMWALKAGITEQG